MKTEKISTVNLYSMKVILKVNFQLHSKRLSFSSIILNRD